MSKKGSSGASGSQKQRLIEIADGTLAALDRGSYILEDVGEIYLTEAITRCIENTKLYPPESVLANWTSRPSSSSLLQHHVRLPSTPGTDSDRSGSFAREKERDRDCKIIILRTSTLAGARLLSTTTAKDKSGGAVNANVIELEREENRIGILNFASAKHPGGGFKTGAQAQEESIARSSTLYPSLASPAAELFYQLHRHDPQAGYYSHAMIYSPNVLLLRDDDGQWLRPICADVLTSPAVNTKVVKQSLLGRLAPKSEMAKVERVMRERAARALYAFERSGVRHLVLGAWGCGVFGNDVRMVAGVWADLLAKDGARFKRSFDRIVFAILGQEMFREFEAAFEISAQGDGKYNPESMSLHSV